MAAAPAPTTHLLLTAPVLSTLCRLAVPSIVPMLGSAVAAIAETAQVGQLGMAALARDLCVRTFLQQGMTEGAQSDRDGFGKRFGW